MAMHTDLSIYKAASGLLQMATNLTKNIPRELKQSLGRRVSAASEDDLLEVANSYFGLFRQATHSQVDRAALANALLRRGRSVNGVLTKTYRKPLPA